MKTFQTTAPGEGGYFDVPVPVLAADEVLVKVSYCGICGTDYALYSGNSSFVENGQVTYPIRLGHEWSGVVESVGSGVTKVKAGDPVVGDNFVSCNECPACLKGDYNNCTGRHNVGTIDLCWPGSFAEYYMVPERHVYKLAEGISLKEAALCEPLSVAYGGVRKMDMNEDSVVVVIGTGSIGMAAAALSRWKGAGQVYLIGRNSFKLEIAKSLGITGVINSKECDPVEELKRLTGGRLADYIIECSGNPSTVQQSLDLATRKGKIALVGFYESRLSGLEIDTLVSKEITLIGIMGEYGNLEAVANIMSEYDLKLSSVITEVVPFDKLKEAIVAEDKSRVIKTMVKMEGADE